MKYIVMLALMLATCALRAQTVTVEEFLPSKKNRITKAVKAEGLPVESVKEMPSGQFLVTLKKTPDPLRGIRMIFVSLKNTKFKKLGVFEKGSGFEKGSLTLYFAMNHQTFWKFNEAFWISLSGELHKGHWSVEKKGRKKILKKLPWFAKKGIPIKIAFSDPLAGTYEVWQVIQK